MLEALRSRIRPKICSPHLPEEARLNRPLNIAPGKSEYEIVDYFRERGDETRCRLRVVSSAPACINTTARCSSTPSSRAASF